MQRERYNRWGRRYRPAVSLASQVRAMRKVERIYEVRGKQVRLQELPDLIAVRGENTRAASQPTRSQVENLTPPAAMDQVRALESAGWTFLPREEGAGGGAKVFLKSGDRVALGTNRLSVRMSDDLSPPAAEQSLHQMGFQVVDRLKFAPNLFVVAAPESEDLLEAAARLAKQPKVEFAEPELIEVISGR